MEENQKIIELQGLSNIQLLQQFSNMIMNEQVQRVILQIKFKQKLDNKKIKIQKNLQEKTIDVLNSTKLRIIQNQFLEKIKIDHSIQNIKYSFIDELSKLYQLNQYQNIIKQSIPKQQQLTIQLKKLQYFTIQEQKQKILKQYNFITFIIGNCYFRLKNYDQAQQFYLKIIDNQQVRQRAQRMNNLGTCYAVKKLYQKALKSYNQAIKYYSYCPDENTSNLLSNIAMIYMKSQMYKTAEQFFTNSILQRKQKSCNNKSMFYNSYFNLGICQKNLNKYDVSINNLLISLNYTQDCFNKKMEVLHQVCKVYQLQQKWSDALALYQKISQEYQKQGKCQVQIYQRVSKIHQKLGNIGLSKKLEKMAIKTYHSGEEKKINSVSSHLSLITSNK